MSIRFKVRLPLYRWLLRGVAVSLVAVLLGGCGTVSRQTIDIETAPEGAFVYVNGKFIGNSPVDVRLNRQVPHRVELRKAGFVTEEVMLYPSFTDGEEPTVVFGPLRTAGYYRELSPNPVSTELVYQGLAEREETLGEGEAAAVLERIAAEVEAGELSAEDAEIAAQQVMNRLPTADQTE
ncbi:MAG: PEGA domain-containing protein [Verrucomicrobiota bacterium]